MVGVYAYLELEDADADTDEVTGVCMLTGVEEEREEGRAKRTKVVRQSIVLWRRPLPSVAALCCIVSDLDLVSETQTLPRNQAAPFSGFVRRFYKRCNCIAGGQDGSVAVVKAALLADHDCFDDIANNHHNSQRQTVLQFALLSNHPSVRERNFPTPQEPIHEC